MKIRKTNIQGNQTPVFIHENKKEEYTVVAIPHIHWSIFISYEEEKEEMIHRILETLPIKPTDEEMRSLAERIYLWVREM